MLRAAGRPRRVLLALVGVLGFGLACTGRPSLRILSPGDGSELTFAPLRIEIDFKQQHDSGTFAVTLNGQDVTSLFLLLPPHDNRVVAVANLVFDPYLAQGANVLEASIPTNLSPSRSSAMKSKDWRGLVSTTSGTTTTLLDSSPKKSATARSIGFPSSLWSQTAYTCGSSSQSVR